MILLRYLELYKLDGINIDFEDLQEKKNEVLVQFQKSLYEKMHARGLLVQRMSTPLIEDYNFKELSAYNDYVILMAYDQFSDGTGPGPICHQKWIEGAVDDAIEKNSRPTNSFSLWPDLVTTGRWMIMRK